MRPKMNVRVQKRLIWDLKSNFRVQKGSRESSKASSGFRISAVRPDITFRVQKKLLSELKSFINDFYEN